MSGLKERERRQLSTRLFVSPMKYTVDAHDYSFSCYECARAFVGAIMEFNQKQELTAYDSIKCECRRKWVNRYGSDWYMPIIDRVDAFLKKRNYV